MDSTIEQKRQDKLAKFSFPLLSSNFASVFGEGVYRFGLNWFLVSTYGNAKLLGWLTGFGFIVYLLNDMYVGAVLDRFSRKWVLVFSDLFGAIGMLILSLMLNPAHPQTWLLFAITFVMYVDISYAYPAARSILPDVIKKSALARFNAYVSAAFSAGQALGPLIGGILLRLDWIDLRSFMFMYGMLLLVTAGINFAIRTYPEQIEQSSESFISSMKNGFKYVWQMPKLFESMLITLWSNFCFEAFIISMPFLVQRTYQGTANEYSLALTAAAISGILAGFILARYTQYNNLKTLYVDFFVLGVALIVATFINNLWALVFVIILNGFVRSSFVIKVNTVRQEESSSAYLGRVFGISFFATDLFAPIVSVTFGYSVSYLGVWSMLVIGVMLIVGMLCIKFLMQKRIQN
ncbi:MFS family permease [Weissella uvarum]|uniref:MFS transporter n=1 Tax=Weissella uvarum TaxID=1479233 RepID=UPI0019620D43|nr:MFS transporter [Weissella uvarum]MBM7617515.1 MFS family permease [Weissella uvarum]MCM0595601.1 MFS transporter [Weissella uvarum]